MGFKRGKTLLQGNESSKITPKIDNRSSFRSSRGHNMNIEKWFGSDHFEDGKPIITGRIKGAGSRGYVVLGENDKKDKKEFEKRCRELSGEVKTYNIKDLDKGR